MAGGLIVLMLIRYIKAARKNIALRSVPSYHDYTNFRANLVFRPAHPTLSRASPADQYSPASPNSLSGAES